MKLLKPTLQHLRGSLPMIQHEAPGQVVQRKINGSTLIAIRKRVLARCGYLCECPDCRAGYPIKLKDDGTTNIDHIVQLSEGGGDGIDNLRALYIDCHKRITKQQAIDRAAMRSTWSDRL